MEPHAGKEALVVRRFAPLFVVLSFTAFAGSAWAEEPPAGAAPGAPAPAAAPAAPAPALAFSAVYQGSNCSALSMMSMLCFSYATPFSASVNRTI